MVGSVSISGCAPDPLEIDCAATLKNAKTFEIPDDVDWDTWPSEYASMNAGDAGRSAARSSIQKYYPGAQALVERVEVAHTKEENGRKQFTPITDAAASAYILENTTKDNKVYKAKFTDAEWKRIYSGDDSVVKKKEAFLDRIAKDGPTCSSFVSISKKMGTDPNTYFYNQVDNATRGFMVLQEIHQCDLYGRYGDYPCFGEAFVSEDSGPIKPVKRNPFMFPYSNETTQKLAEFEWCFDQGLYVNIAGTDCEE